MPSDLGKKANTIFKPRIPLVLAIIAIVLGVQLPVCAEQQLLRINQPAVEVSFIGSTDDGSFQFHSANKTHTLPRQQLVRWSTPRPNLTRHEVVLVDGSRLVLAAAWVSKEPLQIENQTVTAVTSQFGKVTFPRSNLRAVLLKTPAELTRRTQLLDQLLAWQGKDDQLRLINGDTLTGKLESLGGRSPGIEFTLDGTSKPVTLDADRIAGFVCGTAAQQAAAGNLAVGFSEGSNLVTRSLNAKPTTLQLQLACGVLLTASDTREIVYLQSLAPQPRYLSDLDPVDYHHDPFLDIPWPYRRDRNLLGGSLTVKGSVYPKGLAMHSTSRLTYNLPGSADYKNFAAQLALADTAENQGSVIYKIYLHQAGKQKLVYTSPIIRGETSPRPISIKLTGADQLTLAVEHADRGDQHDHATWLDARLE